MGMLTLSLLLALLSLVDLVWESHLVSLSCRRLVEISAVTSLSGMPSLSQVTRALGKELISALNSRTSSSSADSYSPNSGLMDINSLAVRKEERQTISNHHRKENN